MPYFDPLHPLDSHQRNLPHWQQGEAPIFLTWTLADSLPEGATTKLKARRDHWLASHPKPWTEEVEKEYDVKFANPINEMLDRGHGECILRDPNLAIIVGESLLSHHEEKYRLHSFVIMPNHVHVLVTLFEGQSLSKITQSWKGASARYLNLKRGKSGTVWQKESWDPPHQKQSPLRLRHQIHPRKPQQSQTPTPQLTPLGKYGAWALA